MATERQEFIELCASLKQDMLEIMKTQHQMPQKAIDWVDQVIEYNCIGGKLNRGISVIHCADALTQGKGLTPEMKRKASILGWCIEWLQAFFLVADDIMDESITRRGQPCWYRNPKVKMIAINDAFLLETFVFQILKKNFRGDAHYLQLIELFHDVIFRTELGQLLDLTSQPLDADPDFTRFTMDRYRKIVINKTAYYTFYLSVACAMILHGVVDDASHEVAKKICVEIGQYFQIQDDYLDCYGDEAVIGKVGTDIQDNKCSWLVIQALQRATPEQTSLLKEHYGKHDPASVAKVKELYQTLDLSAIFHAYEDETYVKLCALIDGVKEMPSEVFTMVLSKIFKRNK
ncbi:TPA: hypothetical protein N0F65_002571 [Lagenidium giganteum]|uniref:Farnesyl pyrophosphate synthase n=1 Tax=Lagenidium giganteum TaxID=4803 RepID=A0AAV2YZ50_9STRA|nr:TPA: hypothetical protein N0F65_002571 [Lagenidium giganteum]